VTLSLQTLAQAPVDWLGAKKLALILFLLGAFSSFATSQVLAFSQPSEPQLREVAVSRYWGLLLHQRSGLLSSERSEADGQGFFLAPTGQTSPIDELKADILAFAPLNKQQIGYLKQHPQCAFPERFRYLNETLKLNIEKLECKQFQDWKSHFHPQSVTMIFAASYLGSPASIFGHTFLRIDSTPPPGQSKNDLLDLAISFEADTKGSGSTVLYAIKGLLGSYPGTFSLTPYHLKINLYTNMESRDLWEYKLSLSPLQIDRLLSHAWELSNTHFNYYFFNKNCSYHILSLLEVAEPSFHLRDKFRFMTIPADSVRSLSEISGAVASISHRQSVLHILQARVRKMSKKESSEFFEEYRKPINLKGDESALVLDALLDWRKFKVMNEGETLYDSDKNIEQSLLVARAQAKDNSTSDILSQDLSDSSKPETPPDQGHKTSKISLYGGVDNAFGFSGIEFRPAIHDFLDSDEGYLPHSELLIARTQLEYNFNSNASQNVRLQDFTFAEVGTLSPWDPLHRTFAWRLGGGLFRPQDTECLSCIAARGRGGAGFSQYLLPSKQNALLYTLLNASLEGGSPFQVGYRATTSLIMGLTYDLSRKDRFQLELEHTRFAPYADDMSRGLNRLGAAFSIGALESNELRLSSDWLFKDARSLSRVMLAFGHYY
jgi:hypothetical protein